MKNKNLIAAREKSGKTQKQMATEIGFVEVAYQRYEYGTREPKVTTAIKVANALGVNDFQEFCELWEYHNHTDILATQNRIGNTKVT